jgi:ankyrin repeat protein
MFFNFLLLDDSKRDCIQAKKINMTESNSKFLSKILSSTLLMAAQKGFLETFRELLTFVTFHFYELYVTEACFYNNLQITKYLIETFETGNTFRNAVFLSRPNAKLLSNLFTIESIEKLLIKKLDNVLKWCMKLRNIKYLAQRNFNFIGSAGKIIMEQALNVDSKDVIGYLIVQYMPQFDFSDQEVKIRFTYYKQRMTKNSSKISFFDQKINGRPLLHNAVLTESINFIKFLLSKGANVNQVDKHQRTSLYYACIKGNYEISNILLLNGAIYEISNIFLTGEILSLLNNAQNCFTLSYDEYKKSLYSSRLTNAKNSQKQTLLHVYCARGDIHGIQGLLCFPIQYDMLNAIDDYGYTPLHYAAKNGCSEIVTLLLKYGAKYNVKNNYNMTAEELAKLQVKKILKHHRHCFTMTKRFRWHSKRWRNNQNQLIPVIKIYKSIIKILQDVKHAFKAIKNNDTFTLLGFTETYFYFDKIRDKNGKTLIQSITGKNDESVKVLLNEIKERKSQSSEEGCLFHAVKKNRFNLVKTSLGNGVAYNSINYTKIKENYCTEFLKKIEKIFGQFFTVNPEAVIGRIQSISAKYHLGVKYFAKVRDLKGNTLLHYAYKWRLESVIKYLKENGADTKALNFKKDRTKTYFS